MDLINTVLTLTFAEFDAICDVVTKLRAEGHQPKRIELYPYEVNVASAVSISDGTNIWSYRFAGNLLVELR